MNPSPASLWARQPEAGIPLVKVLDLFEAAYRAAGRSPRTIAWYRERLSKFVAFLAHSQEGEPTLADFTPENFRLFILDKMTQPKYADHTNKAPIDEPHSSSYIHSFYRAVRGLASFLARERLTPANVMAELPLPKLDEKELQPLTHDEEIVLLNAYSEHKPNECRNKAIMMLMLSTGLRKAELISLKDEAVNLDEGFVTVWGKGRRQRSIPFGFKTGWVLQRYRTLHRPEAATPHCDTFFLTIDGDPITVSAIDMLFERARRRTGIKRLHPHLLRHTYGTRSAELGIPTLTLQRFMGHSQPIVTERYSHIAQSERIKRERAYDHVDTLGVRVRLSRSLLASGHRSP